MIHLYDIPEDGLASLQRRPKTPSGLASLKTLEMDTAKRTERMADAHHAFAAVGEGAILQRRACKLGFLCRSESGGLKRISLAQEQERTPGYAIGDPSVTGSRPPSPSLGEGVPHKAKQPSEKQPYTAQWRLQTVTKPQT